ncbi:MAG: DUF6122 family protein [Desulfobacterales bacterium]
MTLRLAVHLTLHVLIPGAVANLRFKNQWKKAWLIMLATMAVDLDHLLATPFLIRTGAASGILHSAAAICCYLILTIIPQSRIIGAGLHSHGG